MPEIKHNFMKGKMNKDLDERLVPNGEYRDALNVQVSTSEGSDVGTLQNILGNSLVAGQSFIADDATCVGSIADEKNDKLYYFVTSTEEHIVNGGFDADASSWDLGTGWGRSGSKMRGIDAGLYKKVNQSSLEIGKLINDREYEVSFTVSSYIKGELSIFLYNEDGDGFKIPAFIPENKKYTFRERVGSRQNLNSQFWSRFYIQSAEPNISFSGKIDDISVTSTKNAIVEYNSVTKSITPIFVDLAGGVLNFKADNLITGINIIDDLLLWTDNTTEPKKINIPRSKAGTNPSGLVHTDLIVEGSNEGLVKEEHITVIKKSPSKAPGLSPVVNRKSGYTSGSMKIRQYFYPQTANAAGIIGALVEEHHEMWIGLANDPSNGEATPVTAGDIINVYKTWTAPDYEEETPIARLLVKEVKPSGAQFEISQIQNGFDSTGLISLSNEIAVKVAVSRLVPHSPSPNKTSPQYHFQLEQSGIGIFERKLPRFAYRYKYEDNEYSSVGPFSEVVFRPGEFTYHPTKAYNEGMINNLKELTLKDFVTADIPKDVVQIDLLYKNEFSPNIYVVKTIDKGTNGWNLGGTYTITTENVYAQIPSNQLIRPWDNVPKKALAQEVTGNRVVYGNYFQNYNLVDVDSNKITPDLTAHLDSRFDVSADEFGLKSIKSQRTYNFGIVYGDEYGRETPVFTNEKANQLVTKSSSANSSAITINVNNDPPFWADYYKIFVKETSNEYYNLAMGRMYDAEDGNVWLSFPSADRNKVDEDTYLVLKKGSGDAGGAVFEEARYKVVAIENEAPEYIKTIYNPIAEPTKHLAGSALFGGGGFTVSHPASLPLPGTQDFTIRREHWENTDPLSPHALNMPNMLGIWEDKKDAELYVSFSNIEKLTGVGWSNSQTLMSDKYKVVSVEEVDASTSEPGYNGGAMHLFKLSEMIPTTDSWYTDYVATGSNYTSHSLRGGKLKPHFYKKEVENKPEFDGRFFVKIIEDDVIKKHLTVGIPKDNQGWLVESAIEQLYYIADEAAPTINANEGTTNNANKRSRYRADWYDNLGGQTGSRWFIDAANFAGSQPLHLNHPKESEVEQNQVKLSDVESGYNYITYKDNRDLALASSNDGGIAFTRDAAHGGWQVEIPPSSSPLNTNYLLTGQRLDHNATVAGYLEGGNINLDSDSWIYTDLFMSEIVVEEKYLGTKVSTGVAFLKGVHEASYSTDSAVLADLSGDGGYKDEADSLAAGIDTSHYLHLSFGGIGPVRNNTNSNSSGMWYSDRHKAKYWDNYNWEKNWNVGVPGQNSTTDNQAPVVSKLHSGQLFRLVGDNNIYKIVRVTVRRLYNHQGQYNDTTEWFNDYEEFMLASTRHPSLAYYMSWDAYDATGYFPRKRGTTTASGFSLYDAYNTTNEIEPKDMLSKVQDANFATGNAYWKDTTVYGQHQRMIQPDNCRLSYLIEYEVLDSIVNKLLLDDTEMADLSLNTQFTTTKMNTEDFGRLEFISEFNTNVNNLLTTNPAIFETEPKEDVGLDIYYEATGKIPTRTLEKSAKVQNLIHVGAALSITPVTTAGGGATGIFVNSIDWDGADWVITVSSPVDHADLEGEITILKFHNNDGTYITASWLGSSSGTATNQLRVAIHPNTIGLGWFNCWSFGNGVESNRIGDTYNKPYITNGVKASTTLLDSYKEEHRKYGLIYSGIYNSTSGVNDLNQFIAAEKITKDINPSYGSIQKLHSKSSADGDLITLCEDRILKILANKDALYNADGNPQLIANNNVLGQAIPFSGEFGISTNPESFASESYRVYFTDKVRGAVMRLSRDGLTPISDHGMKDWFRDNLKLSTKLIGSYDDRGDEYNITLADRSIFGEELIVNGNFEVDPSESWIRTGVSTHWAWDNTSQNVKADADPNHKIGQFFPGAISVGRSFEVSYVVGGTDLEGKVQVTLHDNAGNYKSLAPGQPATSLGKHVINVTIDSSFIEWNFSGSYENSIQFHIKSEGGVYFNGTIDNVSVREIRVNPKTVSFKEDVKGWNSFKSFVPENALSVANDYHSIVDGKLYKHYDEGANRNNFYGVDYNSSVNVLLNDGPGIIKSFSTLNYEGSQSRVDQYVEHTEGGVVYSNQEDHNSTAKYGWFASAIVTDKQKGSLTEFIEKEGKWFNYIKGPASSTRDVSVVEDFGAFDLQGVGECSIADSKNVNNDGTFTFSNPMILGFTNELNISMQVGDTIYSDAQLSPLVSLGVVTDISGTNVTVELANVDVGIDLGDFIFFSKNKAVNTSSLLGYYADVKFENNSKSKVELFSIGSEISESSK